jgi:class 3 adenylate cyclase
MSAGGASAITAAAKTGPATPRAMDRALGMEVSSAYHASRPSGSAPVVVVVDVVAVAVGEEAEEAEEAEEVVEGEAVVEAEEEEEEEEEDERLMGDGLVSPSSFSSGDGDGEDADDAKVR